MVYDTLLVVKERKGDTMFVTIKDVNGCSNVWHMSCVKVFVGVDGYFANVKNGIKSDSQNIRISPEEYKRVNIMKEQEDEILA